jgi:hypothetical protein
MFFLPPLPTVTTVSEHDFKPFHQLVEETLADSRISVEVGAIYYGTDRAQFRRALDGQGHLSWTRLSQFPTAFKSRLGWRLLTSYGIPPEMQRAVRIGLALIGKKRMSRAALRSERTQEQKKESA